KTIDMSAQPKQTIEDMLAQVNKIPLRYHRKKDGTVFPVEISASYCFQSGKCLATALIRDITERKMAEEALETSQRKLRYLTSKLITAREQEQKRISKELHDELGQALLALKLQVRAIEQKLDRGQQNLRDKCLEMLRYIDEVVENVHRLSRDLSPLILENLGLTSALRWLTEEFTKRTHVKSSVQMEEIEGVLASEAQILVYRIFQECLTNIAKHANASHMTLVVRREGEMIRFQVEDDGCGFDPTKISDSRATDKGLGLAAMVERVRMLGGMLDIASKENEGTKITFTAPVNQNRSGT
ncbi:MAG: PAS domain-containing sensor histidine kinase, partial [Desulforhabdus sp.]|nr:PAS domain-containing sensor histidine kinase [Desulforhabdus sp.]